MRQRFIQSFPTSKDIQSALDNKELGKPYVALSREEQSIDWNSKEINYAGMYFTIEALEDGNLVVSKSCQYSINKGEWITIASSATIAVSNGDKVRFKDDLKQNKNYMFSGNTIMSNVYGNIMSLMYGDNFIGQTTVFSTEGLFRQYTGLKDAANLILPATELAYGCYSNMFYGCTSLKASPSLPATTLAYYCYSEMFRGCTSLAAAPSILPATTLDKDCYTFMFYGCSSLKTAPELPATVLTQSCYHGMFDGCSSLTTAPELPATTLAYGCYSNMFYGCTSLTKAPELPATKLEHNCYAYMFYGCTNLTQAPSLPATTLTTSCYNSMFQGCTSLTTAPSILPATTLVDKCYYFMFYNCAKLNYIKCLATDISATECTGYWLFSTSSQGTFVKHPNATWPSGNDGIPDGWTVEDAVI